MRWKHVVLSIVVTVGLAIGAFNTDGHVCQLLTQLAIACLLGGVALSFRQAH